MHPGVAEFNGYRDGVDGDMAGLTQCGRRPRSAPVSGKLACWLGGSSRGPDREHRLQAAHGCRHPEPECDLRHILCVSVVTGGQPQTLADTHEQAPAAPRLRLQVCARLRGATP